MRHQETNERAPIHCLENVLKTKGASNWLTDLPIEEFCLALSMVLFRMPLLSDMVGYRPMHQ